MLQPALYLIPVALSDQKLDRVLPASNIELVGSIRYFIVENVRSARRFLKKCNKEIDIDSLHLDPLERGESIGVISEAGCPAIADPGADVVAMAQKKGLKVVPLVGPSSILMSLMASGFNGQSFAFQGYLPIDSEKRKRKLAEMERNISSGQTQIFIETPYRNNRLLAELIQKLRSDLQLCVAVDITGETEEIRTLSIKEWAKTNFNFDKRPAIFLLYK